MCETHLFLNFVILFNFYSSSSHSVILDQVTCVLFTIWAEQLILFNFCTFQLVEHGGCFAERSPQCNWKNSSGLYMDVNF